MKGSKVSIIIPSYNHEKFIGKLIESIYAQTYRNFELVILDDGSKDGSRTLLQELSAKHGFTFVAKENEGLCKTLNRGLALVDGDYVMIIGSDDYIPETRLEEQVSFLDSHPDIDVVAGAMNLIDLEGHQKGQKFPALRGEISFKNMLRTNRIFAATAMIRRSVYDRFGFYKDDHVFEDFYMWLKILRGGGKIFNTTQIWAFYRINNQDLEKKFNWYFKGAVQALSEFPNDQIVLRQMRLHRLAYSVKMSLFQGKKFLEDYSQVFNQLSIPEKVLTWLIAMSPYILREKVMKFLNLKT